MKATEKRTVTLELEGVGVTIDIDENWQGLLARDHDNRLGLVSSPFHFLIHLKHMDLPEEIKNRFWTHYTTAAAVKARDVATYGLTATNSSRERYILDAAVTLHEQLAEGFYANRPESFMYNDMLVFAMAFAEIVHNRDAAALRRMVKILEDGGLASNERGGVGSADGDMFEKFVVLHIETRSLPTKMALRNACGLGDRADYKVASKRMKKLGLWGLPTETPTTDMQPIGAAEVFELLRKAKADSNAAMERWKRPNLTHP